MRQLQVQSLMTMSSPLSPGSSVLRLTQIACQCTERGNSLEFSNFSKPNCMR